MRMTTNKKVCDMGMTELARNSCYVRDNEARYRDFETDVSARDLTRDIMIAFGQCTCGDIEMSDDEAFDEMMYEYLASPPDTTEGLIALFYRNLWAMAELHAKLKRYEDAEEQGLLLRLPCKAGTKVWQILRRKRDKKYYLVDHTLDFPTIALAAAEGMFGKMIYLTEEEAQAKLAKLEGDSDANG